MRSSLVLTDTREHGRGGKLGLLQRMQHVQQRVPESRGYSDLGHANYGGQQFRGAGGVQRSEYSHWDRDEQSERGRGRDCGEVHAEKGASGPRQWDHPMCSHTTTATVTEVSSAKEEIVEQGIDAFPVPTGMTDPKDARHRSYGPIGRRGKRSRPCSPGRRTTGVGATPEAVESSCRTVWNKIGGEGSVGYSAAHKTPAQQKQTAGEIEIEDRSRGKKETKKAKTARETSRVQTIANLVATAERVVRRKPIDQRVWQRA
eukprot:TRINITY_DN38429_c0_g1_i1.p1 TRINITY_DN38429_c0_g1~~TRINITY_DN38429_c0_g1_i1.p1  ORF type:complete len:259 (-),score=28.07 TRINITY_DN38429_c0_g1_i1:855-1631(-)